MEQKYEVAYNGKFKSAKLEFVLEVQNFLKKVCHNSTHKDQPKEYKLLMWSFVYKKLFGCIKLCVKQLASEWRAAASSRKHEDAAWTERKNTPWELRAQVPTDWRSVTRPL